MIKNLISKYRIFIEFALILVLFLVITSNITIVLDADWADKVFGPTCFIFAILLGFSSSNRKARLDIIRTNLRKCDALYVKIYELAKNLPKKDLDKIRNQMDTILVAQIDYRLVDIDNTTDEIIKLMELIDDMKVAKNLESYKSDMYEEASELLEIMKEISYRVKDRIKSIEWVCISLLLSVILMILNTLNIQTWLSIWIISLVSTCMVLLLIFLNEMDHLAWQEKDWIWNPLIDLFHELDLLPYFPENLFGERGIMINHLKPMKAYRKAHYAAPYPDNTGKTVEIVTND